MTTWSWNDTQANFALEQPTTYTATVTNPIPYGSSLQRVILDAGAIATLYAYSILTDNLPTPFGFWSHLQVLRYADGDLQEVYASRMAGMVGSISQVTPRSGNVYCTATAAVQQEVGHFDAATRHRAYFGDEYIEASLTLSQQVEEGNWTYITVNWTGALYLKLLTSSQ